MDKSALDQLTQEDLIELLLKQHEQVQALQASILHLQHENEVLRKKLEQLVAETADQFEELLAAALVGSEGEPTGR